MKLLRCMFFFILNFFPSFFRTGAHLAIGIRLIRVMEGGKGEGDGKDSDFLALLNFIKPVSGLGSVSSERKRLRRYDLDWLPHAVKHAIRCTSPENDCESRHELERARAAEAECRTEARLQHIMSSSGSDGFTARHAAHALLKSATVYAYLISEPASPSLECFLSRSVVTCC